MSFNTHLRGSVPGSIGIPIPGTEVRIVDAQTNTDKVPRIVDFLHELPKSAVGKILRPEL